MNTNWILYNEGGPRVEGLFARKHRNSSGDKGICYGDIDQAKPIEPAPIHVLAPLDIKAGSPVPKKMMPLSENEPCGMLLFVNKNFLSFTLVISQSFHHCDHKTI